MKKNEVLELLQAKARQKSELEKWLQGNNQKRLAEFVDVQRLINFKVQDIICFRQKDELRTALYSLHADLLASLEHAKEYQSTSLIDLYASALDYYHTLCGLLTDYLNE